jgi:hypothetical protein
VLIICQYVAMLFNWKANVQVMYAVARKFGFQTFNRGGDVKTPDDEVDWVPATASLAADHLCQLIITDGLPRAGKLPLFAFAHLRSHSGVGPVVHY